MCRADKACHLALEDVAGVLKDDFAVRRANINGRLSREIFDDDCLFDGPDPDMPVRGVHKYCSAISGLFDRPSSACVLVGEPVVDKVEGTVVCHWRLSGRLRLPWRPAFKPYLGFTTYHVDPASGLVCAAVEQWSISAVTAFASVLVPFAVQHVAEAPDVHTVEEWLSVWVLMRDHVPKHLRHLSA